LRFIVARDYGVVCSRLRVSASRPEWQLVGQAPNGKDAIAKVIEVKPDIAVIGYSLRLMANSGAASQYRSSHRFTEGQQRRPAALSPSCPA